MKKSGLLVAMAVMTAAPAMAETSATLYGSLRLYAADGTAQDLDVSNDGSRIGIKGTVDTSLENVQAIYRLEALVGQDNGLDTNARQNEASFGVDGRLAYVGLKGDFGQITAGQQWSVLYNFVTGNADMTYFASAETQYYLRVDSSTAWESADYNGFQFGAAVFADTDVDSGKNADHFQVAAKYAMGNLTLAAGMDRAADANTPDVTAVSATWSQDSLTLVALLQNAKADTAGAEAVNPYELGASYTFGANTLILTWYDADAAVETNGMNLELHAGLGDATTIYANIQSDSVDGDADQLYGLGLKVDF